jgi:hypothetical protein
LSAGKGFMDLVDAYMLCSKPFLFQMPDSPVPHTMYTYCRALASSLWWHLKCTMGGFLVIQGIPWKTGCENLS